MCDTDVADNQQECSCGFSKEDYDKMIENETKPTLDMIEENTEISEPKNPIWLYLLAGGMTLYGIVCFGIGAISFMGEFSWFGFFLFTIGIALFVTGIGLFMWKEWASVTGTILIGIFLILSLVNLKIIGLIWNIILLGILFSQWDRFGKSKDI